MTWDPSKRRWKKMHKGEWYRVTCTELGCPPNKADSYRAANRWWEERRAAIDSARLAAHPHADILRRLERNRDRAQSLGLEDEGAEWAEKRAAAERMTEADESPDDLLISAKAHFLRSLDPECPMVIGAVFNDRRPGTPTTPDRSIEALGVRFLENTAARMEAGELSASEFDTARRCLRHAVEFFGPSNEPTAISADRWEAYWRHLLKQVGAGGRSREYAKKDWRYAKAFVRWLASLDKMTLPKNLDERRYRFGDSATVIEPFTPEEVRRLVAEAPGQTKLHLLLMLNTGMYQGDISDLRHDEVDWSRGVITRQRSKTRRHGAKVPTVSYTLWPITLDLLRAHRSDDPLRALTTRAGKPWVEPGMKGDKFTRRDGIKSNFAHLQRRFQVAKPLKIFRKTSASLLDHHPEFGRYAQFFLGHSGRSVAEKHYVKPSQEQFDRALRWLGQQYGFLP